MPICLPSPAPESVSTPTTVSTYLRRHAWFGVLVVGAVLFAGVERTLVATQNPNLVPAAILLGAAVVPAAFVAFISGRRLPYTVSGAVIGASAFFGGMIGLIVAGTLEFDAQHDLGGLPMIGVGLIEETSKLLVPLALLIPLRLIPMGRHRSAADGLLLGVACGAGFAALETMGYGFSTLLASKGSITDTVDTLLLRGFLSPAGHMAWTGITAAALRAVGVIAYWSVGDDPRFAGALRRFGLTVETLRVRAHDTTGPLHTLYVAARQP